MTFNNWIQRRENGLKPYMGDEDFVMKRIYKSLAPYKTWNETTNNDTSEFGAVFNLEFSPEGNLLVAACENKTIVLFDPITTKQTKQIHNAHSDNVNCVKFLDNRMFATCSDDNTVAIWDIRNLKNKIRSLQGHSNWVKNIEYSQKDGLLVTSGFDGSIYTWDINSYTEQGFIYQKVFHTSGLMRCRISPDATKLVICTTGGYLIIIHDLDLTTLHKDLCGFRPNIYRLMQLGRQYIPQAAKFDHVFSKSQKKNRVELISDFPNEDDAEVILALQIHPQGWCCLSRNISYDEGSEWSCIHHIQEREGEDIAHESADEDCKSLKRKRTERNTMLNLLGSRNNRSARMAISTSSNVASRSNISVASTSQSNRRNISSTNNNNRSETFVPDIWAAEVTVQDRACRTLRGTRNANSNNFAFVYAISSGVLPVPTTTSVVRNFTDGPHEGPLETEVQNQSSMPFYNNLVHNNSNRLMYYIEEPNKGKGFIKEPSFSADGRIICSPYAYGIRLLAFSNDCSELPSAISAATGFPEELKEIKRIKSHNNIVVSSKFSPRYPLLVTGCLQGKIVWHHPNF